MKDVANILHDCCQFEAAENLQREALNLRLEILGGRHPDTISAMSNLAATSYRRGLLEDAEKLQRKAVALRLEILGREHPRSLDACYNLALMLYEGNQLDEATKLLQETMALRVVMFGADHTHTRRPQQLLNDLVSGQPPGLQTHTFLLSSEHEFTGLPFDVRKRCSTMTSAAMGLTDDPLHGSVYLHVYIFNRLALRPNNSHVAFNLKIRPQTLAGTGPSNRSSSDSTTIIRRPTIHKPSSLGDQPKGVQLGFLELASGKDPIVDSRAQFVSIIAIHGLDGHREKTWTADNGVLWLRDLLSVDIPNARILVYGYDADTRSRECVSTQTIYQHADKFLKSLSRQRSGNPRALVLCQNQSRGSTNPLRDILVSTHAVLFFGTPHSGVKGVDLLQTMNRLLSLYLKTTDVILRHLGEHSPELENIQNLYISASAEIETVLFYEVYPTPIIGGKSQLIVPHYSATVAGDRHATEEGLDADHCQMVKFIDTKQRNYVTVLSYLKRHIEGAVTAVTRKWSTEDAHRGVGKTQLAMNWIREHESSFTRVIVVDASSQTQLEKDLELSIRVLGPEYSKMTWNDAVAYLDGKAKGWLLFFDNADSPDLDLRPYLPMSTHGAVMITTRNSEYVGYAPDGSVPVGDLEESEAIKLLHTVAKVAPQSDVESLKIVKELGMLALAITQAGAYIRKTRRLDTYLDTFRSHRHRLLRKQVDIGSDYTSSTYTAFDLSFDYLPTKTREFLKLCAFLHHSLIPIFLFEESIKNGFTTYIIRKDCPPPETDEAFISGLEQIIGSTWDEGLFQDIIESASRASFIDVSIDGLFYTVHPLLQAYIKDDLNEQENQRYAIMRPFGD
ncbi:related to tetratricopeptide repeat domain protein-Neosartorya fischeri [Serendipita indica DSM 11827]|uniref:Related to tetratricopeptide repeat domain protein-Neosartorya fischeri n=1 Tax=Serendipita indica (strain DSM 11827) TaxID=1109443 RepID=G4TYC8_SERID|nr:related to tetratricopeptide repeat domain protein-Neosartorya fischeri [Serendipita indica DSM 11827]